MVDSTTPSDRTAQVLAERYGAPVPARRRRRALWFTAGGLAAVGVAALVMIGIGFFEPDATASQVGFDVVDDSRVHVIFDVTKPEEATATCTLEALTEGYGQAGIVDVTIGPQDRHTTRISADIATTELATTGVIRECRLVD
ncbi:DUF4307 domain-containing protein [Ruania albidiflava]|uniref:DUF4307 domain-containing protein n=1 Tax=Ruania albidiflava TaxID=366586 RepID=UPI0003B76837|nr:DUF4307 domain-containing protein [Ruania albidiflava]